MNGNYSKKVQCIIEEGKKYKDKLVYIGPTGPTARCNKSSIYIFKW